MKIVFHVQSYNVHSCANRRCHCVSVVASSVIPYFLLAYPPKLG